MVKRTQKLSQNNSLFVFGARGVGKTTLIRDLFAGPQTLWIDLLSQEDEENYRKSPSTLSHELNKSSYKTVVIDEVQKVPKLLDIVHMEIERQKGIQFVMSGSSARKLKRGAANLLAGRAFTYHLYPLTCFELGSAFELNQVLQFGSLPSLFEYESLDDIRQYLRSYVRTYLREEIQIEQIVRNVEPFRSFLEVAAQVSGKIINYSKISDDLGVDDKTVKAYFQILEDTLIGFRLPAFHRSVRKRQRSQSKFFLFDLGVKRALQNLLTVPVEPQTFEYGSAFEHFLILESHRLNEYHQKDFNLSYLRTKDDAEIDLVIERPGQKDLLVENKSYTRINPKHVNPLKKFKDDWDREAEAQIWSNDPRPKVINDVQCLPWQEALQAFI